MVQNALFRRSRRRCAPECSIRLQHLEHIPTAITKMNGNEP
jgi:hypothetical protein